VKLEPVFAPHFSMSIRTAVQSTLQFFLSITDFNGEWVFRDMYKMRQKHLTVFKI
jgi:hypothetical protein